MPWFIRYAMARPNARSSHKVPTPQGGGAIVLGAALMIGVPAAVFTGHFSLPVFAFAFLAVMMGTLGAIDDLQSLGWRLRLGVQALLIGAMLLVFPDDLRLIAAIPVVMERALALILGVWFVNLTNFMDGIDGLLVVGLAPLFLALGSGFLGVLPVDPLALAFAGALCGFMILNAPPARIFAGDVGSLALGFAGATLLFVLAARVSLVAALLLPLYFGLDASLTLMMRAKRRAVLTQAHRDHAYQQAVDSGMSVRTVIAKVLILNIILAVMAGVAIAWPDKASLMMASGVILTSGLLAHFRWQTAPAQSS